MRIDFIELSGFRGFRDKVHVEFGRGFTVITGRNGVGKSTICDAIEFAITGRIEKYAVERSDKENIDDYFWWRGRGKPEEYYVRISFLSDDEERFTITRIRESGADRTVDEIRAALCSDLAPDSALRQLTRTSIIRDEWIAALSVDLTEIERFDLVRSALGAVEGMASTAKAKEIVVAADKAVSRSEEAYEVVRSRLAAQIAERSDAQVALSRSGDLAAALRTVNAVIRDTPKSDIASLLVDGRKALADRRTKLAHMNEALMLEHELEIRKLTFNSPEAEEERQLALADRDSARIAKDVAVAAVAEAEILLSREEDADSIATSLASLVEHGERLGLHDDQCPLCAAYRTSEEFSVGLEAAQRRIATLSSGVQAARFVLAEAEENLRQPSMKLDAAEQVVRAHTHEKEAIGKIEESNMEFFERYGLEFEFLNNVPMLIDEIDNEHNLLVELERALNVLEASLSVSRMSAAESKIADLHSVSDESAEVVRKAQIAARAAREIERCVKRVSAEIVDEHLAQISPLLNELYQRLRPHTDWRTIEYNIRGDVRRFLSLKVGDGLNPQFVFSSGQRRAVGLAFLLSVHLSRGWTPLRSLILDDPVQHIDDFRALQLVEVLAALRVGGRQIICAVEDPSLADLLCRRLHSSPSQEGRRIDIDLGQKGTNVTVSETEIAPMPVGVLRRGSNLKVVGD